MGGEETLPHFRSNPLVKVLKRHAFLSSLVKKLCGKKRLIRTERKNLQFFTFDIYFMSVKLGQNESITNRKNIK